MGSEFKEIGPLMCVTCGGFTAYGLLLMGKVDRGRKANSNHDLFRPTLTSSLPDYYSWHRFLYKAVHGLTWNDGRRSYTTPRCYMHCLGPCRIYRRYHKSSLRTVRRQAVLEVETVERVIFSVRSLFVFLVIFVFALAVFSIFVAMRTTASTPQDASLPPIDVCSYQLNSRMHGIPGDV